MKAILLSIKPKYVADILNGKKTIEIRKSMLKCDLPIDVYIYCTKENKKLVYHNLASGGKSYTYGKEFSYHEHDLNGKVVAKFTLRKIEAIDIWQEDLEEKMKLACLSIKEFDDYSKGQVAYAWHIEDLVIFDEPKELSVFKYIRRAKDFECFMCDIYQSGYDCFKQKCSFPLTKAPQSYCFVEVE